MSRPTHRLIASGDLVFPEGYDPADIVALTSDELADMDLAEARAAKLAAISERFVTATLAGCASPKGWVDCDEVAQGRVDRLVKLLREAIDAGMDTPPTVDFTMYDKTKVPHTLPELVTLGMTIGFHFLSLFGRKQQLETEVGTTAPAAAVDAIDIESGWPA